MLITVECMHCSIVCYSGNSFCSEVPFRIYLLLVLQEDCNRDLPWYTSVKALQGRVEVTSFELMKNIQTYGRYNIGLETSSLSNSISDAVHVDLNDREHLLAKKSFTLDELRDLESKLILITGSRAENRKEVDHFLDVSFFA